MLLIRSTQTSERCCGDLPMQARMMTARTGASMRREACTRLAATQLLSRNNNGGHHEPITMSCE